MAPAKYGTLKLNNFDEASLLTKVTLMPRNDKSKSAGNVVNIQMIVRNRNILDSEINKKLTKPVQSLHKYPNVNGDTIQQDVSVELHADKETKHSDFVLNILKNSLDSTIQQLAVRF